MLRAARLMFEEEKSKKDIPPEAVSALYWRIVGARHVLENVTRTDDAQYVEMKRSRALPVRYLQFVQALMLAQIPDEVSAEVCKRWESLARRQEADFGRNFLEASLILLEDPDHTSTAEVFRAQEIALHTRHTFSVVSENYIRARKNHSGNIFRRKSMKAKAPLNAWNPRSLIPDMDPKMNWRVDIVAPLLIEQSGGVDGDAAYDLVTRVARSPELSWSTVFTPSTQSSGGEQSLVSGAAVLGKGFPFLYSEEEVPLLCDLWERIEVHGVELSRSLKNWYSSGFETAGYGYTGWTVTKWERSRFGSYVNRFFAKRLSRSVSSIFVWLRSRWSAAPIALVQKLLDIEKHLSVHSDYTSIDNIRSFVWVDLVPWVRTQFPAEDAAKVQRLLVSSALWPSMDALISEEKDKEEDQHEHPPPPPPYNLFKHSRHSHRLSASCQSETSCQVAELRWLDRLCDFEKDFAHKSTRVLRCSVGPAVLRHLWLQSQSVLAQSLLRQWTSSDRMLITPGGRRPRELQCHIRKSWRKAMLVSRIKMHHRLWSCLTDIMDSECSPKTATAKVPALSPEAQYTATIASKFGACFRSSNPSRQLKWEQSSERGFPAEYAHTLWEARILWFQWISAVFSNKQRKKRDSERRRRQERFGFRTLANVSGWTAMRVPFGFRVDGLDPGDRERAGSGSSSDPDSLESSSEIEEAKAENVRAVPLCLRRKAKVAKAFRDPSSPAQTRGGRIGDGWLFETLVGCYDFTFPSYPSEKRRKPILAKRDACVGVDASVWTDLEQVQEDADQAESPHQDRRRSADVISTSEVERARFQRISEGQTQTVETRDASTQLNFVFVKDIDPFALLGNLCPLASESLRRLRFVVWGGSSVEGGLDWQACWSRTKVIREKETEPQALQSLLTRARREKETAKDVDNQENVRPVSVCEQEADIADCVLRFRLEFLNTPLCPSKAGGPRALVFSREKIGGPWSRSAVEMSMAKELVCDHENRTWGEIERHLSKNRNLICEPLAEAEEELRKFRMGILCRDRLEQEDQMSCEQREWREMTDEERIMKRAEAEKLRKPPSPEELREFRMGRLRDRLVEQQYRMEREDKARVLGKRQRREQAGEAEPLLGRRSRIDGSSTSTETESMAAFFMDVDGQNQMIDANARQDFSEEADDLTSKADKRIWRFLRDALVDTDRKRKAIMLIGPYSVTAKRDTTSTPECRGFSKYDDEPRDIARLCSVLRRKGENGFAVDLFSAEAFTDLLRRAAVSFDIDTTKHADKEVESVIDRGTSANRTEIDSSLSPLCLETSREPCGSERERTAPAHDDPGSQFSMQEGAPEVVDSESGLSASETEVTEMEGERGDQRSRVGDPASTNAAGGPFDPIAAMESDSMELVNDLFEEGMPSLVTEAVASYSKLLIEILTEFTRLRPVCPLDRRFDTVTEVMDPLHFATWEDDLYNIALMLEDFFEHASSEGLSLTFRPGEICDNFRHFIHEKCRLERKAPPKNRNDIGADNRDQDQPGVSKSDRGEDSADRFDEADADCKHGDKSNSVKRERRWILDDGAAPTWIEDPEKFSLLFFDSLFDASPLAVLDGPSMEYSLAEISDLVAQIGLTHTGVERLAQAIHEIRLAAQCPLGCSQFSPALDAVVHAKSNGHVGCQGILCANCWDRIQGDAIARGISPTCPFCRGTVQEDDVQPELLFRRVSAETQRLHYRCQHCDYTINLVCLAECDREAFQVGVGRSHFSVTDVLLFRVCGYEAQQTTK